ncbi:MAG: Crp/Fnr family transcriptional regulator [Rickettsiales bacterium]|nr:Crp/Fnr family transcriptional regulator [Rickettsiales bacterium]
MKESLANLPFYVCLSEEDKKMLCQHSMIREYDKNAHIFRYGKPTDHFYLICSGWVKIYCETVSGDEAIVDLLTTGNMVGEQAIFSSTAMFSAQAVCSGTILLEMPVGVIRERLEQTSSFISCLLSTMVNQTYALRHQIKQLDADQASERVALFLRKLYKLKRREEFTLPFKKALLANYLGMKPETLSRALSALKNHGVCVDKNRIMIFDTPRFESYCTQLDTSELRLTESLAA